MNNYNANKLRFDMWMQTDEGHNVASSVIVEAGKLRAVGFKKYGIAPIWETVRYNRDVVFGPQKKGTYKLNNTHRAFMVRWIENEHGEWRGFFTQRKQQTEEESDAT